ncbi:hypothetical protein MYCTH_96470 [Thermothelomyces thermophilus ATCC 42464]|uniref:Uncharacterized protein n=1 Tax=Thermothelomyces thermophilus (strain ATCC 42464 / BCRC 31852 / DSM 1799) TaxID=573729 RepID=G2QNE3_THET4|nr:uncharacterized protein MYCTH_96470 [Thermothelomyces thermophilus ATCC 42464]AEO62016.1 hypothetical protein MYCTH_96470 [Thermothelomyces thermophilus ATCC 42464]
MWLMPKTGPEGWTKIKAQQVNLLFIRDESAINTIASQNLAQTDTMSQQRGGELQLSGETQSSGNTTYSLERYLGSDGGVTERLLTGLNVNGIMSRARVVQSEAGRLADKVTQPPRGQS